MFEVLNNVRFMATSGVSETVRDYGEYGLGGHTDLKKLGHLIIVNRRFLIGSLP